MEPTGKNFCPIPKPRTRFFCYFPLLIVTFTLLSSACFCGVQEADAGYAVGQASQSSRGQQEEFLHQGPPGCPGRRSCTRQLEHRYPHWRGGT